jgi:hypothetical protein
MIFIMLDLELAGREPSSCFAPPVKSTTLAQRSQLGQKTGSPTGVAQLRGIRLFPEPVASPNPFRKFPVRIPKGFRPKGQGCDEGATLGKSAKSAVSRFAKPANAAPFRRAADLEIGETAGWETCATLVSPASAKSAMKCPG